MSLENPKVELASIRKNINGELVTHIAFYIPRFSFLDKRFTTWQFLQQRVIKIDEKVKLSTYLVALRQMRKQLDEWVRTIEISIEKYGDLEPEDV